MPVDILAQCGAEKVVKNTIDAVDDYYVGYWGGLLIPYLEVARRVKALEELRFVIDFVFLLCRSTIDQRLS